MSNFKALKESLEKNGEVMIRLDNGDKIEASQTQRYFQRVHTGSHG
ncbi:hypothetical protein QVH35_00320 [Candidatus Nitrosotenuis chungbukensis]|nr:hypothetical protein [Candidatus Nitrosotenuis chungbukensis]WKT58026.1 hypothetical protein QVH35_00320 [Candidatus Nitrosotenuis chungbukensis]